MNKVQSKRLSVQKATTKTTSSSHSSHKHTHQHSHHHDNHHSHSKHSNVPSSMVFQKKRYHGCLVCISGVVSERYTDPSRVLPRSSSDMLAFIKFRSNVERDFFAQVLMLIKHLEENGLLSADGRQSFIIEIMRVFSMANIEAASTNTRPTETDASVDVVGCASMLLELAVALPTTYWAGLGQHQSCLNDDLFRDPVSEPAHNLWRKTLAFLEAELTKPRQVERVIEVGDRLEAQFGGRRAYFPATVIYVHEGGKSFDLKYDSTFAQSNATKANKSAVDKTTSGKDAGFSSAVLDNGEIERRVPLALLRRFPETPRSPREDELMRVISHLKRILRLGIERPVELMHHRRHYMPSIKPTYVPEMPAGSSAVLWMKQKPVPVRGLFDINRTDSLMFNGQFGWPERGETGEQDDGQFEGDEDLDDY